MGFFNFLFGSNSSNSIDTSTPGINPASGLPYTDSTNTIDVVGNPAGTDLSDTFSSSIDNDLCSYDTSSSFDDSFSSFDSGCSGFDDW